MNENKQNKINLEDKYRFLIDEYNNEIKKTKQNKTKQKKK